MLIRNELPTDTVSLRKTLVNTEKKNNFGNKVELQ